MQYPPAIKIKWEMKNTNKAQGLSKLRLKNRSYTMFKSCSLFKMFNNSIQTHTQITSGNKSVSYKNVPLGN